MTPEGFRTALDPLIEQGNPVACVYGLQLTLARTPEAKQKVVDDCQAEIQQLLDAFRKLSALFAETFGPDWVEQFASTD